jgi:cytochrome bd-type quinol oxidase subunit 1
VGTIGSITLGLHIVLGMLLAISIFIALSSTIANLHETSPQQFQDYLVAGIVISLIVLVLVVVVGNALGLISLGNLR